MKKAFILLFIVLIAVGCSGGVEDKKTEEDRRPIVLSENEYNLTLINNEDLEIKLLKATHDRTEEIDTIKLRIEISNKRDKTFEYNFMTLQLDGNRDVGIGLDVHEIKPNEILTIDLYAMETKEIEFEEYIGGEFWYNDYTNEGVSEKEAISEYIN